MAATLASSNSGSAAGATSAIYSKRVSAGQASVVAAVARSFEQIPGTLTDTIGNGYTLVLAGSINGTVPFCWGVWYAFNMAAGNGTVPLPFTGPTAWANLVLAGVLTTDPFDDGDAVAGTGTTVTANYHTSQANEPLIGVLLSPANVSITTPATLPVTELQQTANGSLKAGWGVIATPTVATLSWTLPAAAPLAGGWLTLKVT